MFQSFVSSRSSLGSQSPVADMDSRDLSAYDIHEKELETDHSCRGKLQAFFESTRVQAATASLLLLNLLLVLRTADLDAKGDEQPAWMAFGHSAFLAIFVVELAIRLWAYGSKFFTSEFKMLNIIELAVVVIDVVCGLLTALTFVPQLSFIRIVRVLKFVRAGRMLQAFPELSIMVQGLQATMIAVGWCLLLLAFAILTWSVIALEVIHPLVLELESKNVYEGCSNCAEAYSSLYKACMTIFQQTVAGDSWGLVNLPVMENYPWTAPLFIAIFASIEMCVLNLILAAIVDRADQSRQEIQKNEIFKKNEKYFRLKKTVLQIFRAIDVDGDGNVSFHELLQGWYDNDDFRRTLVELRFDKEDLKTVYHVMDSDGSGSVNFEEFVDHLWRLKHMDSHTMLVFIRHHIAEVLHENLVQSNLIKENQDANERKLESGFQSHAQHLERNFDPVQQGIVQLSEKMKALQSIDAESNFERRLAPAIHKTVHAFPAAHEGTDTAYLAAVIAQQAEALNHLEQFVLKLRTNMDHGLHACESLSSDLPKPEGLTAAPKAPATVQHQRSLGEQLLCCSVTKADGLGRPAIAGVGPLPVSPRQAKLA